MKFLEVESYTIESRRTEDSLQDCQEKKIFEKHIEAYFDKIMRCNSYWAILQEMKTKNDNFKNSYKYAPEFWLTIRYSLQMSLITDLVSFVSNDKASLKTYFVKIMECKNKIFTRKFFITYKNEITGELHEDEWHNRLTNDEVLKSCESKLETASKDIQILKKARDKVCCHYDSISLDLDKCNTEIFNNIKDKQVENILNDISYVIESLHAIYTNIDKVPYYLNKNDVTNILAIVSNYDKKYIESKNI